MAIWPVVKPAIFSRMSPIAGRFGRGYRGAGDDADVAEAAGEGESGFALCGVGGLFLVILVFERAEVGGLRV